MRRVIFTESQIKSLIEGNEPGYPLNLKNDDGKPDNFTEYENPVNNTDKDAPNDVTIGDGTYGQRRKKGWFMRSTTSRQGVYEGAELDNMKTSGYGDKNNAFIASTAKNKGGKMVSNLNAEINSNTGGSRNNTNQVRKSRLEAQKKNDPATFNKNGGEKTLQILKNETNKKGAEHKAVANNKQTTGTPIPNAGKNTKSHHSDSPIYYFS